MPNITMEDFIDECLTGKKSKKKRNRIIENNPINISSILEDDSIVKSDDATDKTTKDDVDDQTPEEEKTQDKDTILSLILNINDKKKIKKFTKENFDDVPLNFQSILKNFGLDLDQISKKAEQETPTDETGALAPPEPGKEPEKTEEKPTYNKFRLSVKEYVTSGAGSEKVELSWRRDGEGDEAVETAEVITSNGSMPFNDSPDPLNAALTTFDRIYYEDIIGKIREELEFEAGGI